MYFFNIFSSFFWIERSHLLNNTHLGSFCASFFRGTTDKDCIIHMIVKLDMSMFMKLTLQRVCLQAGRKCQRMAVTKRAGEYQWVKGQR